MVDWGNKAALKKEPSPLAEVGGGRRPGPDSPLETGREGAGSQEFPSISFEFRLATSCLPILYSNLQSPHTRANC